MTTEFEKRDQPSTLEAFRDELGDEFTRVGRAEARSRMGSRFRRGGLVLALAAIAVPGAIAVAGGFSDSPTRELVPMPAPTNSSGAASDSACPNDVKDLVFAVLAGEKTLADYQQSPGYPLEGCPTVDELQSFLQKADRTATR